ncbi:MAG: type II secretion system F family protein [Planctomycetaceae bacterium]
MNGGHLQAALFLMNRPEPIRQASLLMVLATGIGHGPSLIAGLEALADESGFPWSNRINQLRSLLDQGMTLSESLTSAQGLLPEESLIAIRVAEQTGTLKQVLADEASRLMKAGSESTTVQAPFHVMLMWGILLLLVLKAILTFLMVFIIPKFRAIFDGFGVELPDRTKLLIFLSDWLAAYWYLTIFPLVSTCLGVLVLLAISHYRSLTRGRPLFVEFFPRSWTPMVLRLLSVVVTTQQSLADGLHSILREMKPGRTARGLSAVRADVFAGGDCWQAMQRHGFLTHREVAFLEASQACRHLDWGLIHLSRSIERRRDRWFKSLSSLLEPVMILGMGIVVAFVVIALFSPLVKLLNDLS